MGIRQMKQILRSSVRAVFALLGLLVPCWSSATADTSCGMVIELEVLSTQYIPDDYGADRFWIDYRVRQTGTDACGQALDSTWTDFTQVLAPDSRACDAPTPQHLDIEILPSSWCDVCVDESGNVGTVCCEIPDSERLLPIDLLWPAPHAALWQFVTYDNPDDPTCTDAVLVYEGHGGVRCIANAIIDGTRAGGVDLTSTQLSWGMETICVNPPACALLGVEIDVIDQCEGVSGLRTQAVLAQREGDGCDDVWIARTADSRGVHVAPTSGMGGPVTMRRALPAGFVAAAWSVHREGATTPELLLDGPQAGGSVISGSDSDTLVITATTAADLGAYTFWGIPPGGSMEDAVALDTMRMVADVGQPEFLHEPQPATLTGGGFTTLAAEATNATWYRWRINGRLAPHSRSPAHATGTYMNVDGYLLEIRPSVPHELHVRPLSSEPWAYRGLHATCEIWNAAGGVMSYEVPLVIESLPAYLDVLGYGPRSVSVWTQSASGQNVYTIELEVSMDLGQTWMSQQVEVWHSTPGALETVVPLTLEPACAGIATVRGTVSDGVDVVGTMWPKPMEPDLALSDCDPEQVDQTDFRCPSCPPEGRVRLAQDDQPSEPFTITRTLPPGLWQVRWVFMPWFDVSVPPADILDGPTGRGESEASGSTTPVLTISNPNWLDLGFYAMMVRRLDEADSPEFCADIVNTLLDMCGPQPLVGPASVMRCPEVNEFVIEAIAEHPDATFTLELDGRHAFFPSNQPINFSFDDPGTTGEEISFTLTTETGTRYRITNYTAAANHTFAGWVQSASDDPLCSGWSRKVSTAVVWNMAASECSTCVSDIDGSAAVDFGDIALVLLDFGPCEGCPTDLDGSGAVDFGDAALVLLDYGPCP
jgi:hypothetical protein